VDPLVISGDFDGGVGVFLAAEGWVNDFFGRGALLETMASSDASPTAVPASALADLEVSVAFFPSSFKW
jgi:hypothetical protein